MKVRISNCSALLFFINKNLLHSVKLPDDMSEHQSGACITIPEVNVDHFGGNKESLDWYQRLGYQYVGPYVCSVKNSEDHFSLLKPYFFLDKGVVSSNRIMVVCLSVLGVFSVILLSVATIFQILKCKRNKGM